MNGDAFSLQQLRSELTSIIRTELQAAQRHIVCELHSGLDSLHVLSVEQSLKPGDIEALPRSPARAATEACHGAAEGSFSRSNTRELTVEDSPRETPRDVLGGNAVLPRRKTLGNQRKSLRYADILIEPSENDPQAAGQRSFSERLQLWARKVVLSERFENTSASAVLLNAGWIGFVTDFQSRYWVSDVPAAFFIVDCAFAAFFLGELLVRMVACGWSFWYGLGWKWHWFDFGVVSTQLLDIGAHCVKGEANGSSFLSGLRIVRLVRALRIARIASVFPELHMLISSVVDSLHSLFWTLTLILAFLYGVAIVITQMVNDHKLVLGKEYMEEHQEQLLEFYGTLDQTMVSLYMIISEGIHWNELMEPLAEHISPWMKLVFVIFVGFQLFAMMNVITACFVDNAMRIAAKAESDEVLDSLWEVMGGNLEDHGSQPLITEEVFRGHMQDEGMERFLQIIGAEGVEASDVFALIDSDGDGSLSAKEFLVNCGRLIGNAKALPLGKCVKLLQTSQEMLRQSSETMDEHHQELMSMLPRKGSASG